MATPTDYTTTNSLLVHQAIISEQQPYKQFPASDQGQKKRRHHQQLEQLKQHMSCHQDPTTIIKNHMLSWCLSTIWNWSRRRIRIIRLYMRLGIVWRQLITKRIMLLKWVWLKELFQVCVINFWAIYKRTKKIKHHLKQI